MVDEVTHLHRVRGVLLLFVLLFVQSHPRFLNLNGSTLFV